MFSVKEDDRNLTHRLTGVKPTNINTINSNFGVAFMLQQTCPGEQQHGLFETTHPATVEAPDSIENSAVY